jgi:hypothetical protein
MPDRELFPAPTRPAARFVAKERKECGLPPPPAPKWCKKGAKS